MRTNVAMLICAFAIGQGSLFLAQSWLILSNELEFVGLFGLAYSFGVLAYFVVDWGGMILLARNELDLGDTPAGNLEFWSLVAVRLAIAVLAIAGLLVASRVVGAGFVSAYFLGVAPGLIAAALNGGGTLDGLHRSGWAGLTAMLPALCSAIAVPLCVASSLEARGAILGGAYSIGATLGAVSQHGAIYALGRRLSPTLPRYADFRRALTDGGLVLLTQVPGQLYYRLQLSIAVWLLGPAATGIVVYAKQVSNAALQGVNFVRRAEFPRLMRSFRVDGSLRDALRVQRGGILAGAAIGGALSVGGGCVWLMRSDQLGAAAGAAAAFGPVVFTAAIFGALTQIFVGVNQLKAAASVGNVIIAIGAALTVMLIPLIGILGIAVAELILQVIGSLWLLHLWKVRVSDDNSCEIRILEES